MSDSYKIYASQDYVDSKGLPDGQGAYQQLVTDENGVTKWENKPFYTYVDSVYTQIMATSLSSVDSYWSHISVDLSKNLSEGKLYRIYVESATFIKEYKEIPAKRLTYDDGFTLRYYFGNAQLAIDYGVYDESNLDLVYGGDFDTGEDYFLHFPGGGTMVFILSGKNSSCYLTLSEFEEEERYQTINDNYISSNIARTSDIPTNYVASVNGITPDNSGAVVLPEGFSGSWNDLTEKPFGTSVEYIKFVSGSDIFTAANEYVVLRNDNHATLSPYDGNPLPFKFVFGGKSYEITSLPFGDENLIDYPFHAKVESSYYGGDWVECKVAESLVGIECSIYYSETITKQLDEQYVPDNLVTSTTSGGIDSKYFLDINGDTSKLIATDVDVTEQSDRLVCTIYRDDATIRVQRYMAGRCSMETVTVPTPTTSDAGKFLRVQSDGSLAFETLQTEEWIFTLDDGTEVVKNVVVL